MRLALTLLLTASTAIAGTVRMQFTPSPDANVTYRIYAGTNSPLTTTNALGWTLIGTNTTATVNVETAGRWYFFATALNSEAESERSNELAVYVPKAPKELATMTVEGSINATNWMEVYRIKITTP